MHVTQKTSQHRFCSLTWPSNICFIREVEVSKLQDISITYSVHAYRQDDTNRHTNKIKNYDMHEIVSIKQIVISNISIKYIRKVVIKEFRIYLYNKYVSVFFSLCFYARDRALMLQCHSHLVNVLVSEQSLWLGNQRFHRKENRWF